MLFHTGLNHCIYVAMQVFSAMRCCVAVSPLISVRWSDTFLLSKIPLTKFVLVARGDLQCACAGVLIIA